MFLALAFVPPELLVRQKQNDQPIVELTKKEVAEKRLEDYVLQDDDDMLMFGAWWKLVDDKEVVEVQYPHEHERHAVADPGGFEGFD